MSTATLVGRTVRILPDVGRTAWNVPCCWGGMTGKITGGGGRVGRYRVYRILPDGMEPGGFNGNDFTDGQFELVPEQPQQAALFGPGATL